MACFTWANNFKPYTLSYKHPLPNIINQNTVFSPIFKVVKIVDTKELYSLDSKIKCEVMINNRFRFLLQYPSRCFIPYKSESERELRKFTAVLDRSETMQKVANSLNEYLVTPKFKINDKVMINVLFYDETLVSLPKITHITVVNNSFVYTLEYLDNKKQIHIKECEENSLFPVTFFDRLQVLWNKIRR